MRNSGVILAAAFVMAACGGGGGGDTPDSPPGQPDAMVGGGNVPDPGNGAIPFSWPDTEPNDTPATAARVGTSTNPGEGTWFDGTLASGQLGGTDTEDYFVFRSSPQGGNFHNGPCWDGSAAPNLIDFYVYKVVDGTVGPMVGSSATTDPACENTTGTADFAMEASTVYLLEMRAPSGLPPTTYAA
jgi:hypothetical protein